MTEVFTHPSHQPLALVTRPQDAGTRLIAALQGYGIKSLQIPCLAIEPLDSVTDNAAWTKFNEQLSHLERFHKGIFISSNAVRYTLSRLPKTLSLPSHIKWFAVGTQTAAEAKKYGITAIVPTTGYDSEALLALQEFQQVKNEQIIIMRGVGGYTLLGNRLKERGATVVYCQSYRRSCTANNETLVAALKSKHVSIMLITSMDTLRCFMDLVGPNYRVLNIQDIPVIVPSTRLVLASKKIGFVNVTCATDATPANMAKATAETLKRLHHHG